MSNEYIKNQKWYHHLLEEKDGLLKYKPDALNYFPVSLQFTRKLNNGQEKNCAYYTCFETHNSFINYFLQKSSF